MNSVAERLKLGHALGVLLIVLFGSAIVADFSVQQSIAPLSGDAIRWVVLLSGAATLGLLGRALASRERSKRPRHYFTLVWLVGEVMVIGLVQTLPTPPALESIQALDIHTLDPFAQAALQWGAGWSVVVLLIFVFGGPRLNLGWGIVVWHLAVVSSQVVAGTLPEDALPPLVILPIAALWAAVIFIAIVYGPSASEPSTPEAPVSTHQVTRAVWASLALVMLGLTLAEFGAFVTLDQRVNADRTVTQKAMDGVASGIDKVDTSVTAAEKAVRTHGDLKGSVRALENAIIDVGDQVNLAVEAQQLPSTAVNPRADETNVAVQRVQKANSDLQALRLPLGDVDPATDADQLTLLLSRELPRSITAARREANVAQQVLVGNELPTAGVFMWVAAIYAALVLLPWVLFVLFLLQKRESRARESLIDLCLLDGHDVPDRHPDAPFGVIPPGSLLDRVLGQSIHARTAQDRRLTVGQVQSALVERAFSEPEYLICLALLTAVVAAGWYMVFYPKGGIGIAETIIQGADSAHLWAYLLTGMNPLTAAFAGAYFWCVYALVRRYLDSDLYPAAFLQCAVQFVLALVLSLMIAIAVPPVAQFATAAVGLVGQTAAGVGARLSGSAPVTASVVPIDPVLAQNVPAQPNGPQPPAPIEAITMLLSFVAGVSISAGFTQVLSLLRVLLQFIGLRSDKPLMDQPRLTELEGIDSWTEARFAEEGVENVQALATAPLHRLVLRTHFPTRRLVDWVDQALLYVHTANWPTEDEAGAITREATTPGAAPTDGKTDLFRALRFGGIRTATDLLAAGGWLNLSEVNLADAMQRQQTLQEALSRVISDHGAAFGAAIFTTCQALIESSNWVHVANFRSSSSALLGDDARTWLHLDNHPPSPSPAAAAANGVPHPATTVVVSPSAPETVSS